MKARSITNLNNSINKTFLKIYHFYLNSVNQESEHTLCQLGRQLWVRKFVKVLGVEGGAWGGEG